MRRISPSGASNPLMASGASGQIAEDRRLVQQLLTGDEEAFEAFFEDHFERLYRFARSRLGNDHTLIEEIVQNTLVEAMEELGTWRGEAALFTWLCAICRHNVSAHFRRHRREQVPLDPLLEESDEVRSILESLAAGDLDPQGQVERRELTRLVHLTLDHLPTHYGRALEWKYLRGLPVAEIAARLGLSAKAAESVLTRARGAFKNGFAALLQAPSDAGLKPTIADTR